MSNQCEKCGQMTNDIFTVNKIRYCAKCVPSSPSPDSDESLWTTQICCMCNKKVNEKKAVECMFCHSHTCLGCRVEHSYKCSVRLQREKDETERKLSEQKARTARIIQAGNDMFSAGIDRLFRELQTTCYSVERQDVTVLPSELAGTNLDISNEEMEIRKKIEDVFERYCRKTQPTPVTTRDVPEEPAPSVEETSTTSDYSSQNRLVELRKLETIFHKQSPSDVLLSDSDLNKLSVFVNGIRAAKESNNSANLALFATGIRKIISPKVEAISKTGHIINLQQLYDQMSLMCANGLPSVEKSQVLSFLTRRHDDIREKYESLGSLIKKEIQTVQEEISTSHFTRRRYTDKSSFSDFDSIRGVLDRIMYHSNRGGLPGRQNYRQKTTDEDHLRRVYCLSHAIIALEMRKLQSPHPASTIEESYARVYNLLPSMDESVRGLLSAWDPYRQ